MTRPTADFSPSVWGNHFLTCAPTLKNGGSHSHQHLQNVKEKVRSVLQNHLEKPSIKLNFVDKIQRLGVSYHFENEIEEILQDMHKSPPYSDKDVGDLYTVALWFRLLRQQGYNVSCDIFEQFKEDNGSFKVALVNDVLGMLSLYEAANLRIHGDDVLDQALEFTTFHLKASLSDMSPNVKDKVTHALNCPFHKGVPRIEARYYISVYSTEVPKNDLLLQFAMLDFNLLQAQHQKEVIYVTEWWRKLDFTTKVPYMRDRLVESYFWVSGLYFEPQYAIGRKILAKYFALLGALDDTYDAYGTEKELELFTEAIERCDINLIDSLPECIKAILKAFLDLFDEMELLTAEIGTSSFVQYAKQEVQKLAQAYFIEAKWRDRGSIYTYDEYLENGITSSGCQTIVVVSVLALGHIATKEVFDWVSKLPKIVRAMAIIGRLLNDKSSYKFEGQREHVVTALQCYMYQHGVSEEEALKKLNKDIENSWKDMNEEFLNPNGIPIPVLERVLNMARTCEFVYANTEDKYTHPELMKDYITAQLVDPIKIDQDE